MPKLSVVIPMYNEAPRLSKGVEVILSHLSTQHPECEVLLIDDGSRDETLIQVTHLIAQYPRLKAKVIPLGRNRGKGAAVRTGMMEATGDIRLFTDADNATPIQELDRLLPRVASGRHIVIASRALDRTMVQTHQPFWREWMGRTFNLIPRWILGLPFKDTQCGFKLFGKEAANLCFGAQQMDGFAFDVELLWIARQQGFPVEEVSVRWNHVPESRVHPIFDSLKMARDALRIRFRGDLKRS